MAASNGNCFICGKTAGKTAIKNHVLKEHNGGAGSHDSEACYLLKAEGAYDRDYWLFFSVALDASLSSVDDFLCAIWCECCGHMSAFSAKEYEFDKKMKISQLEVGNTLLYEYDFGSTTEILVTVVDKIERPKQKKKVLLLARNEPFKAVCDTCGAPATCINAWENVLVCDECTENVEDEAALLPVVNSPRCGECAYDGGLDIWTFDPNKPFPQPQKQKERRDGEKIPPDSL